MENIRLGIDQNGSASFHTKGDRLLLNYGETGNIQGLEMQGSRASTKWVTNKNGILEEKAIDEATINYTWNNNAWVGAVLNEGQDTCKTLNSENINPSLSDWSSTFVNTTNDYIDTDLSPKNTMTAGRIIPETGVNVSRFINSATVNIGETKSFSVYMKKKDYRWMYFRENINGTFVNTFFDLDNGVFGDVGSGREVKSEYNPITGFYRISVKSTTTATSISCGFGVCDDNGNNSATGNDSNHNIIFGANITDDFGSYIYTNGSEQPRAADQNYRTIRDLSEVGDFSTGMSFEISLRKFSNTDTGERITVSDGTNDNRLVLDLTGTDRYNFRLVIGGIQIISENIIVNNATEFNLLKFVGGNTSNERGIYLDNVRIWDGTGTDMSFPQNTINDLKLMNAPSGGNYFTGEIKQLTLSTLD